MSCPTEDQLLAYIQGFLPEAQALAAQTHIADCDSCRTVVAEAARDLFGSTLRTGEAKDSATAPDFLRAPPTLQPGAHVGRYAILEVVGMGAMGVVYAAYDPQLDRRVALKVLRPERRLVSSEVLRERLLREGQTMARLSHPNLVAVHDVGALDDGVFLAMEFVEGQTLRAWLAAEHRSSSSTLQAFVEAAKGLSAAHRSGIVHRDFKPDNVLVGKDGRVRVTDFGLAQRPDERGERGEPGSPSPRLAASPSLTVTGAIVGTPAYMSPEQLARAPLDARSDQFSFCVALYEALYHQLPFAADTFDELRAAFASATVRPPNDAAVPPRIRRVLLRGLRPRLEDRYPDMDALLHALAPPPTRTRGLAIGAALATAALAAGLAWRWEATRNRLCHDGDERATAWSSADRARLRTSFAATGLGYAPTVTHTVEQKLDAWRAHWAAARDEACAATHVRRVQPESLMHLKLQCLDDRQRELRAIVDLWAAADAEAVEHAAESKLPDLASCGDERTLRSRQPPPRDPQKAARLEQAKEKLRQAKAFEQIGRLEPALSNAEEAMRLAGEAGYLPIEAEATYLVGGYRARSAKPDGALELLETALYTALRGGEDELAVWSLSAQIFVLAAESRLDEALRRTRLADALLDRLGGDAELRIFILDYGAQALAHAGKLEEAEKRGRQAVAVAERLKGPKDLTTVETRSNLALTLSAQNRLAEALAIFRDTMALHAEALGPEHPDTLLARNNVGGVLVMLRRHQEALPILEQTLAAWRRIHSDSHPAVATTHINLAEATAGLRRWDEAVEHNRRALAILEPLLGADGQALWEPLTTAGIIALGRNRPREALAPLERALKLLAQSSPLESALTRFALAQALWSTDSERARARRLAGEARDAYGEAARRFGGVNGERAAEAEAWLASR